tara:strand:- start:389 stop:1915 length:1527 start_codon:yes stop_codon:yes gene_type:complete
MKGCLYQIGYWFWVVFYYTLGFSWWTLFTDNSGISFWSVYQGERGDIPFWWPIFCSFFWSLSLFLGPLNYRRGFKKNRHLLLVVLVVILYGPLTLSQIMNPGYTYIALTFLLPLTFKSYDWLKTLTESNRNKKKKKEAEKEAIKLEENREKERKAFNQKLIYKLQGLYNYDFSKLDYYNRNEKVTVICKDHGEFKLSPSFITRKSEMPLCPRCAIIEEREDLIRRPIKTKSKMTEESLSVIEKLAKKIDNISSDVKDIKTNTEEIKDKIEGLFKDVSEIKNSSLDLDKKIEKILAVCQDIVEQEDFSLYVSKVKAWFNYWESAEDNTRVFMPGAEFILNKTEQSNFKDYSAFVLYYCRALENELLIKMFFSFLSEEGAIKSDDFEINSDDLSDKKRKEYMIFARDFKRKAKRKNFTLGDMRMIIERLPSPGKRAYPIFYRLPVLKTLHSFLEKKNQLISKDRLIRLSKINNLRRKAAHIETISKNEAMSFYRLFKPLMNEVMSVFLKN